MNRRARRRADIERALAEDAAAAAAAAAPGAALIADDEVHRLNRIGPILVPVDEDAVPDELIPWAVARHCNNSIRELTEDDPRAETPAEFRGELYPPQKTMLAAMDLLENRSSLQTSGGALQMSMARIAAQFSFGKTVLALARVCAARVPRARPSLAPLIAGLPLVRDGYFMPEVTVRYAQLLPLTIVAAAANVISQWEENTTRFTNLRMYTIENVHSLRAFEALFRNGRAAAEYDIVFVKAGRVVSSFVVAGEPPRAAGDPPRAAGDPPRAGGEPPAEHASKSTRSLIGALGRVLEGVPVARLIIDDYDTLKLSADDCFIPALFTWLVSATRRRTSASVNSHEGGTVTEYFRRNMCEGVPVLGAALDDVLNGCCSLRCAPDYVGAHIHSTVCGFRHITVAGGRAAGMLRDLDVPEEVFEMVNADAVGTAAAALGLEAASVGDIVRRVVGGHLDKLRLAARVVARVARVQTALEIRSGRPLLERIAAPTDTVTAADALPVADALPAADAVPVADAVAAADAVARFDPSTIGGLKKAMREGTDAEFMACWNSPLAVPEQYMPQILIDMTAQSAEVTEKYGKTLSRMRDNIREGCCQVCTVPFSKSDSEEEDAADRDDTTDTAAYVLAGCCQIIICEHCVTRKIGGARQFISRCPNCAVDIPSLGTGLIRVGAELDLESALKDDALAPDVPQAAPVGAAGTAAGTAAVPAEVRGQQALAAAPAAEIANPKLRALVQFIRGEPIEALTNMAVPPFVHGLLDGVRDLPWPAEKPRKILVFTMHAESTRHIEFALELAGIPYGVLRGLRTQKDAAVEALRGAPTTGVLLVTSAKDCAGIHMPWLSHIVFYHRVTDRHVEAQVAARGQRLGREHNLEIVLIGNEAEAGR